MAMPSCTMASRCCTTLLLCMGVVSLSSLGWSDFDCPLLPPLARPARTVNELKPQDIKVVMALGDSITAGFSMMGNRGINVKDFDEYRGQSWSMGMDKNAETVPNFLSHYNPNIIGGSLGHHLVEVCYNTVCPPHQYRPSEDVFNAAQSGAMVTDLVSHELEYLLDQLTNNKEVDMKNDWKLLTLFIGVNDICRGCSGDVPTLTVDDYDKNIREVLEEMRNKIPKVFVNLVLLGNISWIYKLSLKSDYCAVLHRVLPIECICAFSRGETGDKKRLAMDNMTTAINQRLKQIAAEYASKKYDEFAVIIQPFFTKGEDEYPINFLSKFDCFHPSLLAHQNMARALWNNMITPAAQKKTSFNSSEPLECPTNTTLLYTY